MPDSVPDFALKCLILPDDVRNAMARTCMTRGVSEKPMQENFGLILRSLSLSPKKKTKNRIPLRSPEFPWISPNVADGKSHHQSMKSCLVGDRDSQTPPSYGFRRYAFLGFFGPRIAFRATGALWGRATPFLYHFSVHLSSVLGRTELCHEVWTPGPQKPQIISNENHHLALLEIGAEAELSQRDV